MRCRHYFDTEEELKLDEWQTVTCVKCGKKTKHFYSSEYATDEEPDKED